jgi:hypothetical protein
MKVKFLRGIEESKPRQLRMNKSKKIYEAQRRKRKMN